MIQSLAVAVVVSAFTAPFLWADTIFSTLNGPQTGGYQVAGSSAASGFPAESVAASFQSATPFVFTGAEVQVMAIGDASFNMLLFASDSSGLPAPVPILVIGNNLLALADSRVVAAAPSSTVNLAAGTTYWLVLTPGSDTTQVSWGVLSSAVRSPLSTTMQTDGSGGWALNGNEPVEFQIDGTPTTNVPEPAALLPLGLFLAALFLRKSRTN